MVKQEEKEIYRLWWEYLKRSDHYKEFLKTNKGAISYAKAWSEGLNEPLNFTALAFGDVHRRSFEQWWKREIKNPMSRINPDSPGETTYIKDAVGEFLMDIQQVYAGIRLKRDDQPENLRIDHVMDIIREDELLEAFQEHMNLLSEWGTVRIEVNLHAPMEYLVKQFRGYMSQKKREIKAREFAMKMKGIEGKPTKDRLDKLIPELQRYLDVYDLSKQGFTMLQIIKKTGTSAQRESIRAMQPLTEEEDLESFNEDGHDIADIIRMYRRYLQKAKNIIENVERGYFPGRYDTDEKKGGNS